MHQSIPFRSKPSQSHYVIRVSKGRLKTGCLIPFYKIGGKENKSCATRRHADPGTCHKFSQGGDSLPCPNIFELLTREPLRETFLSHPSSLLSLPSLFDLCVMRPNLCRHADDKYCILRPVVKDEGHSNRAVLFLLFFPLLSFSLSLTPYFRGHKLVTNTCLTTVCLTYL